MSSLAIRTSSSLLGRGKRAADTGTLAKEEGGTRVIEEGGAGLSSASVTKVGGAGSNTEVCGVSDSLVGSSLRYEFSLQLELHRHVHPR